MDRFFCAEESRQANEDPIGNGVLYQAYILVECPPPWAPNALDSRSIPANLRALKAELASVLPSCRLLLIYNEQLRQPERTRVLLLRQQQGFAAGYDKQEFQVPTLEAVAPVLTAHLLDAHPAPATTEPPTRDILVCTHGSNDQCCARYGNPFYRQVLNLISELSLERVRVWQSSHFSGHRFAPTIIDFPEGRYYGRLDPDSFRAILTRTGNLHCLQQVYRGWGILSDPAQVLERELILKHGWDWFSYRASAQVLEAEEGWSRVELSFLAPDGSRGCYRADVVEDSAKTLYLKGECSSTESYRTPQYVVKNLVTSSPQVVPRDE